MFSGPARGQGRQMTVLRAFARPMLAAIFIVQGFDTLRRPERVAKQAEPVVRQLAERVPAVPAEPEQAVRLNGAIQMTAGVLLAMGRFPRLSALAIAGTLVPTTLAGHRFWEAEEEETQAQQRIHFLKNVAMFGGLLIAAGDTAGKPSLAWRRQYAARWARSQARSAQKRAQSARKQAQSVRNQAQSARKRAQSARKQAALVTRTAKASGQAGARAGKLTARVAG